MQNKKTPQDFETPLSPDEIRAIGEVELGPSKTDQFLDQNYKKIIGLGIAIIVGFSSYITYKSFHEDRAIAAGNKLTQSWDANKAQYDIAQLASIEKEFDGTPAALTAHLLILTENLTQGDPGKAVSELEAFISTTEYPDTKLQAAFNLANYYIEQAKLEDATRLYELIAKAQHALYSPLAMMNLGDLARQQGNKEKASEIYIALMDTYPNSKLVSGNSGVGSRTDLLGVQDPEASQPSPKKLELPQLERPNTPTLPSLIPAQK